MFVLYAAITPFTFIIDHEAVETQLFTQSSVQQTSSGARRHHGTQRPFWMQQSSTGYKQKPQKKMRRLNSWEHEFICLANTMQSNPPSPFDKAELMRDPKN